MEQGLNTGNRFLYNADQGDNRFSSYVLTICIILLAYGVIGQIPMLLDYALTTSDISNYQGGDLASLVKHFGKNKFLVYILLPFTFVLVALLLCVRFIHKRSIKSVITGRDKFDFKRFFFSFFLWGGIIGISLWFTVANSTQIHWNFKPTSFIILCFISLIFITIQTMTEEILFRGYLLQGIVHSTGKPWIAVCATSILFGLMHAANPEVAALGYGVLLYYILTGMFLGIIAMKDNGLELTMGYHAINNIFAAVFLTNNWQAFQTDALFIDTSKPTFGTESLLTLVILQPALLFVFSKVYNWGK